MANNVMKLIQEFKDGVYQDLLKKVYVDDAVLAHQQNRYVKALEEFVNIYGERDVEIYSAPGRSEVGGNHTDHQHGKVLATSINLDVIAVVSKTGDSTITMKSEGYPAFSVELDTLEPMAEEEGTSKGLVRGVAAGLKKNGFEIGGFVGYAVSDVLGGSGLSSSAAYEIAIGNILFGLFNEGEPDPVMLAQVGQLAENVYFGKPCGLLDQMACSIGGLVNIDFENPMEAVIHKVDVDFGAYGHSLCIVDTKGSHADLTDEYAAVPAEMKAVAKVFGKEVLREVDEKEFYSKIAEVRKATGDRGVLRAIHLFNENKRVDAQVAALESGDFERFKKLIKASGDSSYKFLQNVYANRKVQEQAVSIGLAVSETVLGDEGVCRVHGGGFAGTIQAFVPDALVPTYKEAIENVFGEGSCYVLKVRNCGGIKVI